LNKQPANYVRILAHASMKNAASCDK